MFKQIARSLYLPSPYLLYPSLPTMILGQITSPHTHTHTRTRAHASIPKPREGQPVMMVEWQPDTKGRTKDGQRVDAFEAAMHITDYCRYCKTYAWYIAYNIYNR